MSNTNELINEMERVKDSLTKINRGLSSLSDFRYIIEKDGMIPADIIYAFLGIAVETIETQIDQLYCHIYNHKNPHEKEWIRTGTV